MRFRRSIMIVQTAFRKVGEKRSYMFCNLQLFSGSNNILETGWPDFAVMSYFSQVLQSNKWKKQSFNFVCINELKKSDCVESHFISNQYKCSSCGPGGE